MAGVPAFLDVTVRLTRRIPVLPRPQKLELERIERILDAGRSNVSRLPARAVLKR